MYYIGKLFKDISLIVKSVFTQRILLRTLVFRDFQNRYLASYVGLPWAFIQPAVYILVIWFAFKFGLRGSGHTASGGPLAPWLIMAIIPWLFISQTMIVSCNSITEYSYVIKKTAFNLALIPVVKILSGLIVHVILLVFAIVLLISTYGIYPDIYWIQIFYYLAATMILLTGIAWFVSAINVFAKDMAHIINILITMLFWATPIIWPYSKLPGSYKYVALLNPFFYITEGYRYTFIEHTWFFAYVEMNIYFWAVTILIFIVGALTFQKLKLDFGDEL